MTRTILDAIIDRIINGNPPTIWILDQRTETPVTDICPNCEGTGIDDDGDNCTRCNGTGILTDGEPPHD